MRTPSRLIATSLLLVAFGAACSGAKTDRPVVTNAAGDSSLSASGDAAANRDHSLVRVVNALPASRSIDVSGDDQTVFTAVAYKDVTPYTEVGENMVTFRLRVAGGDSALADNHEALADGNRYTIVAYANEDGKPRMRILRDEVVPDQGKARIRVINAAPAIGDVDVALAGDSDPIFSNVAFGIEAGYKDVDPTTGTLDIRTDDKTNRPVQIKNFTLAPGKAYTIVLTGTSAGNIEAITFDDTMTGQLGLSIKP